jgi:hypothetical protein
MKSAILVILMAVAISCACHGQAAEKTGDTAPPVTGISGVVTDAQTNEPVTGAKVELSKNGFALGISAVTDAKGAFVLRNVPPGTFDLDIAKRDYLANLISDVKVTKGETTKGIKVSMDPLTTIQEGDQARDFTLQTSNGKLFNLASLKGKKIVVIGIGDPYG